MTDIAKYLRTLAEAEALTGLARWAEAAVLWERVAADNPADGGNWERLAQARFEAGDYRRALPAYEKVLELGVRRRSAETDMAFPCEVAYRAACCLARAGDGEGAIAWLRRAVSLGLRDISRPLADGHWDALLADERVREALGLIDTDGMPRDDGWRADVRFLAREIKRRARAPFGQIPEPQFDAAVAELAGAVPELTDAQIIAGMLRLLRSLDDGHAFIRPPADRPELSLALPVKFYQFEEGLYVTATAPEHRSLLGAGVLAVGGHETEQALAALDPVISRDNAQQVRWLGPEVLRWSPLLHALGLTTEPGAVSLTLRQAAGASPASRSANEVTVSAVASGAAEYPSIAPPPRPTRPRPAGWVSFPDTLPGPLPLYLRNCDLAYWFEYLPQHDLVYLQFNGVTDHPAEPLTAFWSRLFRFIEARPTARLVIDLRWNGGGNTFLVQPLLHHLIGSRAINEPGALFVIIGRGTFSAAQNTATAIERETSAIFVGEPTGSRPNFIGETVPFELPYSKTTANVSDLFWQTSWPDDHRTWIAPEIYAPPTFAAYRQNRDPAMEAILACREHFPGR